MYICIYIFALYILFAPWSYTSHRLMFFVVNTTENKAYLILSYLGEIAMWTCKSASWTGTGTLRFVSKSSWFIFIMAKRLPRMKPSYNDIHASLMTARRQRWWDILLKFRLCRLDQSDRKIIMQNVNVMMLHITFRIVPLSRHVPA